MKGQKVKIGLRVDNLNEEGNENQNFRMSEIEIHRYHCVSFLWQRGNMGCFSVDDQYGKDPLVTFSKMEQDRI